MSQNSTHVYKPASLVHVGRESAVRTLDVALFSDAHVEAVAAAASLSANFGDRAGPSELVTRGPAHFLLAQHGPTDTLLRQADP